MRLRPQLAYAAVVARLDEAAGVAGWSNRYQLGPQGLCCELVIAEVGKSAVRAYRDAADLERLARDALVAAAEHFGLRPDLEQEAAYWVEADPESGEPLYDPVLEPESAQAAPEPSGKSAGQQAIDRLIDRLRQQGLGFEAAQLISTFQGYGENAEAARELYGKLRNLLVQGNPGVEHE